MFWTVLGSSNPNGTAALVLTRHLAQSPPHLEDVLSEVPLLDPLTNEADPELVALRVRAYADERVDEATIQPALEVADHLLASAGLVVRWHVCDTPQSCPVEAEPAPEIVVILSSRDRQNGRENCGVAARSGRTSAGTVLVSVPCVAGVAFRLTRRAGTGTNPLLAMPRHDDLVGAVVAHEIGHLLGLAHAATGRCVRVWKPAT